MNKERFEKQLAFILEADKEKNILRQTHLIDLDVGVCFVIIIVTPVIHRRILYVKDGRRLTRRSRSEYARFERYDLVVDKRAAKNYSLQRYATCERASAQQVELRVVVRTEFRRDKGRTAFKRTFAHLQEVVGYLNLFQARATEERSCLEFFQANDLRNVDIL